MVKKSIAQLREKAPYELKRKGHAKQKKKLLKAYQGKRLKKLWSSYASWECCTIVELKDAEHVGHRMKGGHHHRRNYSQCSQCAKWFRSNKGEHEVIKKLRVRVHFCSRLCSEAASSEVDWETGWPYEPHHVIEDDIIKE